jgi:fatty acid desaturase
MTTVHDGWIHDARKVMKESPTDFFEVDQRKYWFDLVLCTVMAYGSATLYLSYPLGSWQQLLAFPFAVFWLYRGNSMVHEVSHLGKKQFTSFGAAWNLLLGIPTLFPSTFFTTHHRDHHSGRHYGTTQDPEYIVNVFTPGSFSSTVFYVLHVMVYPIFVLFRFLLAPISFLRPSWRDFTLKRLSSFTLNWKYERNLSRLDRKKFLLVEMLCCARAWMIPLGLILGVTVWTRIPLMYLLAITILGFNQMRFFADHHFESHGEKMTLEDHVADSCNYSNNDFLTWLFFPFTIRFHALHHLFPTIPYHNLPEAHRHLTENLPADSVYHSLDEPSWWHTAKQTLKFSKRDKPVVAVDLAVGDAAEADGALTGDVAGIPKPKHGGKQKPVSTM